MSSSRFTKPLFSLADVVSGSLIGRRDTSISDIVSDSRQVTPGALFVAMPGGYSDGHDYIEQAVSLGASAVLVERVADYPVPALVVESTRAALSPIAAEFFDHPSRRLNVVGVTGTDGKTSTSTIAEAIYSRAGYRTGLIGTVQIKIGDAVVEHETRQTTPESLDVQRLLSQMVDQGVEWAFLEATSHGLAMHRLDDVRFAIAAVTNITHEHIDFHGTREGYWFAKRRLFEMTRQSGGFSVVNIDDPGSASVLEACDRSRTLTYALERDDADIRAIDVTMGSFGFNATFEIPSGAMTITSPLLGGFNVSNSLCAAAIGLQAGIDSEVVVEALSHPPTIAGRMARIDEGQAFNVIVDYAHTPASLEKVLTLLRSLDHRGRIIVVSGSAGERDRDKRPLQGAVCGRLADVVVVTNEDPRFESPSEIIEQIADGARSVGRRDGESLFTIEDRAEAIDHAIALARPGDTVLLAGKGHEGSIILAGNKLPWDEAAVAREAIRRHARLEQLT